jgi:DNA-binding NarL/FixJ family response regulator
VARPCRVLIVEDDSDYLEALALVLGSEFELTLCGTVKAALATTGEFDAICVDLGLPDGSGLEVVRVRAERFPEVPIIVLTVSTRDPNILASVKAGARGYLLKEQVGARLGGAIHEAIAGGSPLSPSVARRLMGVVASIPTAAHAAEPDRQLTERELEVLGALSRGLTYEQAASELTISLNTLRTHVRHLYEKLCVGTRTEALLCALQLGLLKR